MPADAAAILEAESRCREAGAAFAAAVSAQAAPAEIDRRYHALMAAAETVVALRGEAIPGDHSRPPPAPPPPAPPPSARITPRPTVQGPKAIKPPDLFG